MTNQEIKPDCLLYPKESKATCRRAGCRDFQTCPAGQAALQEGEELIIVRPDSKRKKPPKFTP